MRSSGAEGREEAKDIASSPPCGTRQSDFMDVLWCIRGYPLLRKIIDCRPDLGLALLG